MTNFKVGDTVIRRSGKAAVGTIERIGKDRAIVYWHGANSRRIGSTTPDKRGSIRLSSLLPASAENVQRIQERNAAKRAKRDAQTRAHYGIGD